MRVVRVRARAMVRVGVGVGFGVGVYTSRRDPRAHSSLTILSPNISIGSKFTLCIQILTF